MKDYLEQLADCVHDTKFNRLPASAIRASKLVLLDTIGAMVAGSALPENVRLARMAQALEVPVWATAQNPVQLGPNSVGWLEEEFEAWAAALPRGHIKLGNQNAA